MIKALGGGGSRDVPRLSLALLDGVFSFVPFPALSRLLLTVCKRLLPPEKVKAGGSSVTETSRKSLLRGNSAVGKETGIPAQSWAWSDVHEVGGEEEAAWG